MRTAQVLFKDEAAGTLTQHDDGSFSFAYDPSWVDDPCKAAISIQGLHKI
jgi:serine/threonine-protein kinase HipA